MAVERSIGRQRTKHNKTRWERHPVLLGKLLSKATLTKARLTYFPDAAQCQPPPPPVTTEPGVLDNKYYVRSIGQVAELSVKGPKESLRLVEISS
jgi:hypothetical protein